MAGECEYPAGDPVYQFTLYRESDTGFLCNRFYISKFYLSRSFENATGKSIYQYVLEKRMIMARQLLISGENQRIFFHYVVLDSTVTFTVLLKILSYVANDIFKEK